MKWNWQLQYLYTSCFLTEMVETTRIYCLFKVASKDTSIISQGRKTGTVYKQFVRVMTNTLQYFVILDVRYLLKSWQGHVDQGINKYLYNTCIGKKNPLRKTRLHCVDS